MNMCSDDHEEIVYNSRTCPLCDVLNEKKDLFSRIEDLEREILDAQA
jgi:hypothetical protein